MATVALTVALVAAAPTRMLVSPGALTGEVPVLPEAPVPVTGGLLVVVVDGGDDVVVVGGFGFEPWPGEPAVEAGTVNV